MAPFTVREAEDIYHVPGWGDGYYRITGAGTLAIRPLGNDGPEVDLHEVVTTLAERGMGTPLTLRFPQVLHHRVDRLNKAFHKALKDNGCKDTLYRGVFPIKVNQRKDVVQTLAKSGRKWSYGLEVGSKAELIAALTMDQNRKSLLVVNGFKDKEFLEAACEATYLKDTVIIVMDEVGELEHLIPLLDREGPKPLLGIRLKLRSKAPGKWALSGGERAKFGLTIPELLHAVERLRESGHIGRLAMLHFHIGSQISDIRRIIQGVREAGRIHAELVKMGVGLRFIDVGGGMAVDYDGSGSSGPNSANYTMEEYASSIVAQLKDVCDEAGIPMPDIINESGRAVVSHHAILVVNAVRKIPYLEVAPDPEEPHEDDPTALWNLHYAYEYLSPKNVFESFHDAVQYREDLQQLFDLGHLNLEALGRGEALFRAILGKVRDVLREEEETDSEEYEQANALQSQKLVCNFSLFQSLPDVWGVKQQFPIMPIHRLRERPDDLATVADITCDSDGEIRRFIDVEGTRPMLNTHKIKPGEPYYLGMALVGAYQDTLGDYHNLFGETNEAWVEVDVEKGTWDITRQTPGSKVSDMLRWVRYSPADLRESIKDRVGRLKQRGRIDAETAKKLSQRFVNLIDSSTYLEAPKA
ncbi:MAG TPA: biosynthetic arginine decarboxylase [Candidatus Thermoplasmatota archaeon]|nr:biosynthetic arginine decarboxylase [Candidatus Thermoplasmatota archaeon]